MISTGLAERVGIRHAIRLCANGVGYRRDKRAVTPVSSARTKPLVRRTLRVR